MSGRNKQFSGLVITFFLVSLVVFLLKDQLANLKADYKAVLGANALLFILSLICLLLQVRALSNPNPNVFVRSVMLSNIIKLVGLGIAVFIYVSVAGKEKSANAIFIALFLYVVYTIVEKRAAISLSKSRKN